MTARKLCFLLLLLVVFSSEETLVKTIGKKPDSTQICSKTTLNITVMILCEISTERSRGEQCRLLYRYDRGFIHGCDSRFTLIKENETVFLHLLNLTSEDSGNYTCECGFRGGLYVLHLSVTVRDDGDSSGMKFMATVPIISAAASLISVAVITCGYSLRRNPRRENRSGLTNLTGSETRQMFDKEDRYMSLHRQNIDVYQTISSGRLHHDAEATACHSHVQ
ncbi:uncharacterized protein LOC113016396 isoform X1 [Astatotilapia calliptera]|uniref:uncharacterized protein LOC113016396 isoform X1 n=1 Tax=Astatotilapia calliptera TaxID=8154 RepID=UPI000E4033B2|nr:uncharacterized protein LOC113016396 isoform X1 [Astatotilapia calliptera]